MTRHFCVLTTGRTGSSQLMASIAAAPGVLTPMAEPGGVHYELLHPRARAAHLPQFLGDHGPWPDPLPPQTAMALVQAFQHHATAEGASWSGFKTMPHQIGPAWRQLTQLPDLVRITLVRRDLAAAVASFLIARLHNTWARRGGTPEQRIRALPEHRPYVEQVTGYMLDTHTLLARVPAAIAVAYEDLVSPGWQDARLDALFEAPVRVANPKGATPLADQVENWQELAAWVRNTRQAHAATRAGLQVSMRLS